MRIALAGNPNSGKTSMYNLLTEGMVGTGFVPGAIVVAVIVAGVVYMIRRQENEVKK